MTFLEMAALFNFMFLMEMLIFFYKHQQKADHKESTGNPDHSDSIAYGQISPMPAPKANIRMFQNNTSLFSAVLFFFTKIN